jgi:predicted PurR-regulated permease PerM
VTAQQTFRNTLVVVATLATAYIAAMSIRILVVLLVSIIIASSLRPIVLWLTRRRIPVGLAILIVYALLFIGIFTLGFIILPPVITQLGAYLQNENGLAARFIYAQTWLQQWLQNTFGAQVQGFDPDSIRQTVTTTVNQFERTVPSLISEFGALLGDFILVVVMGVYWLTSRDQAFEFLIQLFPIKERGKISQVFTEVETSLGAYVRGVVFVCTFVGVANFIIMRLLGVDNATTLAFIIGITTSIPIIGGYIGAGSAVLLALLANPVSALATFGSFVLVQQVENHYLTPRTMSRSVNLNPILVIVALFAGFAIGGVGGGLLAVPVASMIITVLRTFVIEPMKTQAAPQMVEGKILLPRDERKDQEVREAEVTPKDDLIRTAHP